MSKNHFIRFLRQFRDTNRYRFVQAVSRNHLITPSKMIFRDTREVGTSQLVDPIAFEMIFSKLVRFLGQFLDTNQYLGIQAVPANNLITSSKMIFRGLQGRGMLHLIDSISFESKGN